MSRTDRPAKNGLNVSFLTDEEVVTHCGKVRLTVRSASPEERHSLGAHYIPRAYVERLVLPTVAEPLRADWADAQAAALLPAGEGEARLIRTGGADGEPSRM